MKLKHILISTVAASVVLLAGCSIQTADTNSVSKANSTNENVTVEVVANTNGMVSNKNTNDTTVNGDIDISDWLTYTNKEYGFSFRYPRSAKVNQLDTNHWSIEESGRLTVSIAVNDQDYQTAVNEKPVQASITEQKELTINGQTATLQIGMAADLGNDSNPEYPFTIFIIPLNNKTLNLSIDSQDKQSQSYLEEIITTLR